MSLPQLFSITHIGRAVLTFIVGFLTWYLWRQRPKNSPPGTNGLPFLGVILSMSKYTEKTMTKWAKLYGPIYMVKAGPVDVVVISSSEIAYEAYAKSEFFNDRPIGALGAVSDGKGIAFINKTDIHTEQRRFGLNTLRLFGMGRRTLKPQLIELSRRLCEKIDSLSAESDSDFPFQAIDVRPMFYETMSSVISCMIFGSDITAENKEFNEVLKRLGMSSKLSFSDAFLMFAPFLKHVFPFSHAWYNGNELRLLLHKAIAKEVDKNVKSIDYKNPRDFIDCFLIEMQKFQDNVEDWSNENPKTGGALNDDEFPDEKGHYSSNWRRGSSFELDQLIGMVRDLFLAGTETTANTMSWLLLFLSKYPEFQKKMQKEIDDVIGHSGIPRMNTMEKMPYVRAVIQETLRIRPIAPMSLPHKAAEDAKLSGYHIPKGAILLTNIWGIHHDEKLWSQPGQFMPERHLDADGKFLKSDNWIPFNVGGRNCLGQQLAKMELFITTVMLFRQFEFSLDPTFEPNLNGHSIVTLRPDDFKVCALRR